jgi:hypothetical protein
MDLKDAIQSGYVFGIFDFAAPACRWSFCRPEDGFGLLSKRLHLSSMKRHHPRKVSLIHAACSIIVGGEDLKRGLRAFGGCLGIHRR